MNSTRSTANGRRFRRKTIAIGVDMTYRLGVDVGGTFTDLLLFNQSTGEFWRNKTPSTPHDSSEGILNGVTAICEKAGISPSDVEFFLHGTTVATNAVLEGKGARVGLVTTDGYRQVMQIARSFVPGGLAGWIVWPKPVPLAALQDTVEVRGRMDAQGNELEPLDEAQVREALVALRDSGVEALTVSLVNAYLNGAHEKRIGELAAEIMPGIPMSLSHEVLPEMQEYERTLTTVANAAVRPVMRKYIHNLRDSFLWQTTELEQYLWLTRYICLVTIEFTGWRYNNACCLRAVYNFLFAEAGIDA